MSMPLPQLQALLLDILSTHRNVDAASVAELTAQDWDALLDMARRHRLSPLLHWRLTRERSDLPIPETVGNQLAARFKGSAMRALLLQRELLLTHLILDDAGIPHIALKGAYLAFHAYPHPALRPMRDLDILVPKEMALKVYEVLIEGGLSRPKNKWGNLEANLEISKHLPPLRSPSGQVSVEVHTRLFNPEHSSIERTDLADDRHLWQRTIHQEVAGETLTYLSPTDLLLHLIVHSAYDHRLNNGPLVLSDLAYLLESQPIEWPLFWQQAQASGQARGCLLLLKMAERYFGAQPIAWPEAVQCDPASLETMLETASLLTLRDFEARADVQLGSEVLEKRMIREKLGVLFGRLFPSRKRIAATYPISEDSPWIYFWYVVKWWYLATVRLPEYLANRRNNQLGNEARHISQLDQWLQDRSG